MCFVSHIDNKILNHLKRSSEPTPSEIIVNHNSKLISKKSNTKKENKWDQKRFCTPDFRMFFGVYVFQLLFEWKSYEEEKNDLYSMRLINIEMFYR